MINTTQVVDTIFVFNKSIICQVSQRDVLKTVLNIFVEYLIRGITYSSLHYNVVIVITVSELNTSTKRDK